MYILTKPLKNYWFKQLDTAEAKFSMSCDADSITSMKEREHNSFINNDVELWLEIQTILGDWNRYVDCKSADGICVQDHAQRLIRLDMTN